MNQWFVGGSSTRFWNGSTRGRALRRAVVAGCVMVAAGCSMVGRLGYDNLPRLATWRADSYLSLTSDQRAAATRHFEALHDWHRSTQLDDYVALLRDVQRHVAAGDVDEARIRQWRMQAFERWRPIAEQAAPGVVEIAATLTPAQLQHLRDTMNRDNERLRKEWMPADRSDRVEARSRRYVERAEMFLGSLTAEQKQYAKRLAAQVPDAEDAWFRQRVSRQQDLVALMDRIRRERPDEATASRWMRDHLLRYAPSRDAVDRGMESSLAASDAMSAAMFAMATPKQRLHLQRKLDEWVDLLESLKPEPGARAETGARRVPAGG